MDEEEQQPEVVELSDSGEETEGEEEEEEGYGFDDMFEGANAALTKVHHTLVKSETMKAYIAQGRTHWPVDRSARMARSVVEGVAALRKAALRSPLSALLLLDTVRGLEPYGAERKGKAEFLRWRTALAIEKLHATIAGYPARKDPRLPDARAAPRRREFVQGEADLAEIKRDLLWPKEELKNKKQKEKENLPASTLLKMAEQYRATIEPLLQETLFSDYRASLLADPPEDIKALRADPRLKTAAESLKIQAWEKQASDQARKEVAEASARRGRAARL